MLAVSLIDVWIVEAQYLTFQLTIIYIYVLTFIFITNSINEKEMDIVYCMYQCKRGKHQTVLIRENDSGHSTLQSCVSLLPLLGLL